MSETALSRSIRSALNSAGHWTIRIQAGIGKRGGRIMRLCAKGTPDLLVLKPYLWLEVKVPGRKPSDEQRSWHERAHREGVPVQTVSSVSEAFDAVQATARRRAT